MNFFNLALLTFQIILETMVFPKLSYSVINPNLFFLLRLLLTVYLIKKDLKNKNNLVFFLILLADGLIRKYLISYYYTQKLQPDLTLIIFTYILIGFSFIFVNSKDFDELNESPFIPYITKFICSLIFSNVFAQYLIVYHLDTVSNFEFSYQFIASYSEKFIADFIIIFGVNILSDVINCKKTEEKTILSKIFKYFIMKLMTTTLFFIIFNSYLSEKLYDLLFNFVPKPYNIVIYNTISFEPIIRYKIIYAFIYNIFN